MGIYWSGSSNCLLYKNLSGSIRDVFLCANYVTNTHSKIICNDCEMEKWFIQTLCNYEVSKIACVYFNFPAHKIAKCHNLIGVSESDYLFPTVRFYRLFF